MSANYSGYVIWQPNEEELAAFYADDYDCSIEVIENQYLLIQDEDGNIVDKYKKKNGKLSKIKFQNINNSWQRKIKPRNQEQELAFDLLQSRDSKVKLIRGVFGSGKDHLMFNQALEYIEKGLFSKIVFIRPNVPVAGVPDIGYLKGDMMEKLSWTLGPLYDKVGGQDGVESLINKNQLALEPLPFIRGRSFENSIIYVCESQNVTSEVMKLLLGRVGEGSELWINGDAKQIDGKLYEKDNGIALMLERLKGHHLFGYIYLSKTERSEVAELATLLD